MIRPAEGYVAMPLALVMSKPQSEKTSGKTGFGEQLEESIGTTPPPRSGVDPGAGRRPFAPSLPTIKEPVPEPTASGQLAPDLLGLKSSAGSVATINGETFYGTEAGWTETPPAAAVQDAAPTGEELLGFTPKWVDVVKGIWLNSDGIPSGVMQLSTKHYATTETAQKLAALLGAKPVAIEELRGGANGEVPQWELDFGNGKRLNAGLVADMFLRDPVRAQQRIHAELDHTIA